MFVILGANGRSGSATAHALLNRGKSVRVIVRRTDHGDRWRALGAEVAVADILDPEALALALNGTAGAFLLNPTPTVGDPYAHANEIGASLARALEVSPVQKVVVLSSIGAQNAAGIGVIRTLNQIERLLQGTVPKLAFLRCGYFVENWGEVASVARAEGVLPTFLDPATPIPMVSVIDVGAAAANLLTEYWNGNRVVELSGPEDVCPDDVASAFAERFGRHVESSLVPSNERLAVLAADGFDEVAARAMLGMFDGIANGLFAHDNRSEQVRGTTSLCRSVERLVAEMT
jgi:uncharacterized protein YbjT (DUF2867 family)